MDTKDGAEKGMTDESIWMLKVGPWMKERQREMKDATMLNKREGIKEYVGSMKMKSECRR